MQLKVIERFNWAHRGVQVEEFAEGQVIDTEDEDLISVSISQNWTVAHAEDSNIDGKLTISEIKAHLDDRGIEYAPNAKKSELLALLES